MAFSASDAAIEGFRIVRREPKAMLGWALVQLVFAIAMSLITLPFMRPLTALQALPTGAARPTPAQALALLEPMLRFIAVIIPLELVLFSVLSAAVYRVVLRPQEQGLARLRLGGDELRMGILWIELGLFLWAAGIVALVAILVLLGLFSVALKSSPASTVLMVMTAYLVVAALMAWLAVRFSLAGPLTFATRKVQLFAAWRLTQGRFWPLFGCYLLTLIFLFIILMAQLCLEGLFAAVVAGGSVSGAANFLMHPFTGSTTGLMRPDYSSVAAYLTPVRVAALLGNGVLGGVYWSVAFAPAAVAYREFTGLRPEGQAA